MVYEAFRMWGLPTLYPSNKTPETVDVLESGLIFSTVILVFSLYLVLPGLHGKDIIYSAIKITLGVFVTACIMICNFGQAWEVSNIEVLTQYRAGIRDEINATVGVYIGLRSVNITLKGSPEEVKSFAGITNETINYNERYGWDNLAFTQGRAGFGPYAGKFNQEFRASQFKGTPYPILWVAEYFTIDGEGIRWGRFYRQAGYYTHIMIWLAFPLWILSMMLMHMVIRYGGYLSMATGISLIIGNILYATIRNPNELKIPFSDTEGPVDLVFTWGWSFWLNLFTGILCCIIGTVIFIMDLIQGKAYQALATFFAVDVTQDYEEVVEETKKLDQVVTAGNARSRIQQNGASTASDQDEYELTEPPVQMVRRFKKRSTALTRKLNKSNKNASRLHSGGDIEMTEPARKYYKDGFMDEGQADRHQSIPEGDEVFDDTYENTAFDPDANSTSRRQLVSKSGVLDNIPPEILPKKLVLPPRKPKTNNHHVSKPAVPLT